MKDMKLTYKRIDNGYMTKPDYEVKHDNKTYLIEQDCFFTKGENNVFCDSLKLATETLKEMKNLLEAKNGIT